LLHACVELACMPVHRHLDPLTRLVRSEGGGGAGEGTHIFSSNYNNNSNDNAHTAATAFLTLEQTALVANSLHVLASFVSIHFSPSAVSTAPNPNANPMASVDLSPSSLWTALLPYPPMLLYVAIRSICRSPPSEIAPAALDLVRAIAAVGQRMASLSPSPSPGSGEDSAAAATRVGWWNGVAAAAISSILRELDTLGRYKRPPPPPPRTKSSSSSSRTLSGKDAWLASPSPSPSPSPSAAYAEAHLISALILLISACPLSSPLYDACVEALGDAVRQGSSSSRTQTALNAVLGVRGLVQSSPPNSPIQQLAISCLSAIAPALIAIALAPPPPPPPEAAAAAPDQLSVVRIEAIKSLLLLYNIAPEPTPTTGKAEILSLLLPTVIGLFGASVPSVVHAAALQILLHLAASRSEAFRAQVASLSPEMRAQMEAAVRASSILAQPSASQPTAAASSVSHSLPQPLKSAAPSIQLKMFGAKPKA